MFLAGSSRVPLGGVDPRSKASTSGNANQIPSASNSRSDGSLAGAKDENFDRSLLAEVNKSQDARPVEPSSSSKKRTAGEGRGKGKSS